MVDDRAPRVRDVVEEGMAGAHGVGRRDRVGRVAFAQNVVGGAEHAVRAKADHELREAVRRRGTKLP